MHDLRLLSYHLQPLYNSHQSPPKLHYYLGFAKCTIFLCIYCGKLPTTCKLN